MYVHKNKLEAFVWAVTWLGECLFVLINCYLSVLSLNNLDIGVDTLEQLNEGIHVKFIIFCN